MIEVVEAFNRAPIARLDSDDAVALDRKIEAARTLFADRSAWLKTHQRIAILRKLAGLMEGKREHLGRQIAREGGKPLTDALIETDRAIDSVRNAAARHGRPGDPDGTDAGEYRSACLHDRRADRGTPYPGEHVAIIDQGTWDKVHAILAENTVARANGTRAQMPALLRGLIFAPGGRAMTPSHSRKNGRLYRYYVSTDAIRQGYSECAVRSVPGRGRGSGRRPGAEAACEVSARSPGTTGNSTER